MKKYIYILLIFVCMFSLVSCKKKNVDVPNNNTGIENKPLVELDSSEVFKKVNQSVILIFTRTISGDVYSGTGFFIDDKGTFITNYHVIDKAESILIKTSDDRFGEAIRFVSVNKRQDIAILQANVTSTPVEIGDSSTIEVGDKVYTIGYPAITVMGVSSPTFTDGMISKVKQNINDREYIQTTVSITNGNSGGPLINKYGQVIGVTSAGFNYDNIDWANLAIGINHAKGLIELPNIEVNEVKYYFRQEVPYIIKFYYNGEQYNIQTAFFNNKITKPADPIKQGYYVKGWIDAVTLEEFDFNTPIKNDYILTPIFEKNTYSISFNTDGGTKIPDANFKYEESVDLSKYVPLKEGYTFSGWDQNITTMLYNNVTLNANWIPNTNTKYQVDYYYENELGEYEFRESKVYFGTTGEIINVPMITGYRLQYDDLKIDGDGSTILKCFVSEIKLTIKYHSNNGDKAKTEDIKISKINQYNVYEPIKEGLTFECWYEGENADRIFEISNYVNIDKDLEVSLYAKYKEETLWTYFTYDVYDGVYKFREKISDISIPSYILDQKIVEISKEFASGNGYLNSVVIPNSVTSIGSSAFYNCSSLTIIEIPNSVTSIGNSAFNNCSSLSSITIPNSVTSIASYAFSDCTNLTNVIFEENSQLTSIGDYAFEGCRSLTSIDIPNSVTSIAPSIFYECYKLTSINVSDDNQYYKSIDGNIYTKDGTKLILYAIGKQDDVFEIPNSVTSIGSSAFSYCRSLISIEIPDSVTSIGSSAFYDCTSLTSIEIPDSVTSIGNYAFCGCSSLTSIEIPAGVTSISQSLFYNCYNLTSVEIPAGVTSIGGSAFLRCSSLTSIEIPDSVTSIGEGAFNSCSSLARITIPESVTTMESSVFYNTYLKIYCEAKEMPTGWDPGWNYTTSPVYWGEDFYEENGIRYIFNYDVKEAIVVDYIGIDTIAEIQLYIIINEIEYKVTSIGNGAFYKCENLTSITIPDSVTSIGGSAFSGCTSLTSIEIPVGVTNIGSYTFSFCNKLTSIIIPDSVTSIGSRAFSNCSRLRIFCEVTSKPSGWDNMWCYQCNGVEWGYKG